jgi:hypothetical protein
MSTPILMPSQPHDSPVQSGSAIANDVAVAATRSRQTAPPSNPFRTFLTGGVDLLVRGATVASSVVGGPVMAAAVRDVGSGATTALAGSAAGSRPGGLAGGIGTGGGSAVPATLATSTGDQSDLATVQSMQRESQAFNLQLLELQEDVQQENRRFTTVSNVLRAKHDTAKAAVSNIRG